MAGYNLPSSFSGREAGASLVAGSAQQKLVRGTSATFLLSTILALGIASASVPAGAYDIAGGSVITIDPGNPQSWTGALRIGVVGSGTLRILDGGVVTSTSSMVGGHGPIGSGRGGVEVIGEGSKWTSGAITIGGIGDIASAGDGTLTIRNGGVVVSGGAQIGGAGSNASGTSGRGGAGVVEVSGTGSKWTNGALTIGGTGSYGRGGSGKLTITNGGVVTSGSGALGGQGGGVSDAAGIVEVSGADSRWDISGALTIGGGALGNVSSGGSGKLTISTGGVVTSRSGQIGGSSSSANVGGPGIVEVSETGSRWEIVNTLIIGSLRIGSTGNGGSGTLTISDGGVVTSGTSVVGGSYDPGGSGIVEVSEAGSRWDVSGILSIGSDYSVAAWSMGASGKLTISDGGVVTSGTGQIGGNAHTTNAQISGGPGVVEVSGAGSKWDVSGTLPIGGRGVGTPYGSGGSGGAGTLKITDGGVVTSTGGGIGGNGGSGGIGGPGSGGLGIVEVSGAGSRWDVSGALAIGGRGGGGAGGSGTLTIANGGVVSVSGTISLTNGSLANGGAGILNIGAVAGSAAVGAGELDAGSISFDGASTGRIVFNHTDTGYTFASQITDISSLGTIDVRAGVTTLTGVNSSVGTVTVNSGELAFGQNGALLHKSVEGFLLRILHDNRMA